MLSTSIIVPCLLLPDKNRELTRFTEACFESMRQFLTGYELVLVDNGSTVDADWLRVQADVYIRNETNLGFAKAVNQGLRAASGEGLCVCNDDVTFVDDWLACACAAWGERTGVVSSHLLDHDPERHAGRQVVGPGMMFGALWLTRWDVLDEVGYLDETFELMGEDSDLWHRLAKGGYELVKAGWCRHIGNATVGKIDDWSAKFFRDHARLTERWG